MKFKKDTIYKKKFRKYLIRLEKQRNSINENLAFDENIFDRFEFQNKLIDYASKTKENLNCVKYIGYGQEGFSLRSNNKSLLKFVDELKEKEVFRSVKSYFYELSINEWDSIIYMIKYCIESLGNDNSLISIIDEHISKEYFLYSESNKLRDAFYQFKNKREFSKDVEFTERYKFHNFKIIKYEDFDNQSIRVGIGLKNKNILLSDIIYEIENVEFFKINNKFSLNENEWDAFTRFISLIFFSLER